MLGAVYTLWAFNRLFFGNLRSLSLSPIRKDLTRKEASLFGLLFLILLWLGVCPSTVLDRLEVESRNILAQARCGRVIVLP